MLKQEQWSSDFRDFLAQCLSKDPLARSSAKALLQHSFVSAVVKELDANDGRTGIIAELSTDAIRCREKVRLCIYILFIWIV